jgi:hypothetical protein
MKSTTFLRYQLKNTYGVSGIGEKTDPSLDPPICFRISESKIYRLKNGEKIGHG